MKRIQNSLLAAAIILASVGLAAAQTETDLKRYFEGRRVEVKIDMPAAKDGIDVHPQKGQPIDYGRYSNLLKNYGISVR